MISSHTQLGMGLLMHAGIKVKCMLGVGFVFIDFLPLSILYTLPSFAYHFSY